mmetsp:Transcript_23555/g.76136  ORF Transcript_23555/g.76136 Transcript_23555/m.76136 type:complete len:206 (+) Transcript_23555:84-701(+)|eukprot:scaffold11078_cov103-Isochrysis_galbana.AAC.1
MLAARARDRRPKAERRYMDETRAGRTSNTQCVYAEASINTKKQSGAERDLGMASGRTAVMAGAGTTAAQPMVETPAYTLAASPPAIAPPLRSRQACACSEAAEARLGRATNGAEALRNKSHSGVVDRSLRKRVVAAPAACAEPSGCFMRCRINPIPPLPHWNRLAPRGRTDSQRGCGAHTLLDHTTLNLVSKADWAVAFRVDALL